MHELFRILLWYTIKEGPSLPCGTTTTTATADVKFPRGVHTPTTLEALPQPEAWGETRRQEEELLKHFYRATWASGKENRPGFKSG